MVESIVTLFSSEMLILTSIAVSPDLLVPEFYAKARGRFKYRTS